MLQCVAVCCGVLQLVAVCCGVLRWTFENVYFRQKVLREVVCCSVLQCVAVCCSVLQLTSENVYSRQKAVSAGTNGEVGKQFFLVWRGCLSVQVSFDMFIDDCRSLFTYVLFDVGLF